MPGVGYALARLTERVSWTHVHATPGRCQWPGLGLTAVQAQALARRSDFEVWAFRVE